MTHGTPTAPPTSPVRARPVGRDFPVSAPTSYGRSHHDYPATDIFARCGAPVVAVARGRVLEVGRRDRWDPRTDKGSQRGGRFVSVVGADGVRYFGSHLSKVRPGLSAGDHVEDGGNRSCKHAVRRWERRHGC